MEDDESKISNNSNSNDQQSSIASYKQQISKLESENRQLHQVINQLRSVRRVTKEDVDIIAAERDKLSNKVDKQAETILLLENKITSKEDNTKEYDTLKNEYNNINNKLILLEDNLYESNKKIGLYEKECYDKDMIINTMKADMSIIQHDLKQRNIELSNLHIALGQLQKERDDIIKRINSEQDKKIQNVIDDVKANYIIIEENYKKEIIDKDNINHLLKEKLEDESLLRRKAEIEFNNEKKKMQKTLETALIQIRNTDDDVVDRVLVTNLFVDYIQKRRSLDVLALIGKILNFSDEQKEAVGLKVPSQNYIKSFITSIVGPLAPPPEVEGDNLAELWVNFLLTESDESNAQTRSPQVEQQSTVHKKLPSPLHPFAKQIGLTLEIPENEEKYQSFTNVSLTPSSNSSSTRGSIDDGSFSLIPSSPVYRLR